MKKQKRARATKPEKSTSRAAKTRGSEDTTLPPRNAELVFDPATRKKLVKLSEQHSMFSEKETQYEQEKKRAQEDIEMILVRNGIEPKQPVIFSNGPRLALQRNEGQEYIDEDKLLKAGVGADVIARCRSRHKASTFVRITWPKQKE